MRPHLSLTAAFFVASATCLVACGGTGAHHLEPEAEVEGSGLVWVVGPNGAHRTLWVSTQDARPLSSLPIEGPLWAQGSMLWQWIEEPVPVALSSCEQGADASGTGITYRVLLRELTQGVELEVRPAPTLGAVRRVEHRVEPVASVGPLLFLEDRLEAEPCQDLPPEGEERSALTLGRQPPLRSAAAIVWDLRAGRPVEVLTDADREALIAARDRAAEELLRATPGEEEDVGRPELVAITPRWEIPPRAPGALSLDYVFAAGACYACSSGWGPFAHATRVTAERIPQRLASSVRVPRWARQAARTVEGAALAGFSRVEHAGPERLLDTFRR